MTALYDASVEDGLKRTQAEIDAGAAVPGDVVKRLDAGRARMMEDAPLANECLQMWRGKQYVYRNKENVLTSQATLYGSDGLDPHVRRTCRNYLLDVVAQETSASTQRVPGYDVTPSTTDPEDIGAADISKKVASYGYDAWRLRNMTVRVVEHTVITGEGFAWPYFDNQLGTPMGDSGVCTGEINARVYGRNQVMWEPGVLFEDSRWLAVESAEPIDRVMAMPGYFGSPLSADSLSADTSQTTPAARANLARVTHYLERPSAKYREGRHLVLANDRQIVPAEFYPCIRKDKDGQDEYVDEPCVHKLAYFLDPESERDMGLLEHLLDAQRAINAGVNKGLEWVDHALVPQILAAIGSIRERRTNKPGAVIQYMPSSSPPPQWAPVPPVPSELRDQKTDAIGDIARIAAQTVIPNQVESGDAISALIEKDANRRQEYIARLAEFHSRFMRHCLYLVQRHYTEARVLHIRGEWGVEPLSDFLGAQIRGQADVTVLPDSITSKTREQIAAQVMGYADRGWISPEKAMAAIQSGTAGNLVQSYQRDEARAYLVIRKIKAFGTVSGDIPVPRPFDNLDVLGATLEDWMKSDNYDSCAPPVQEAGFLYWQALQQLKDEKAAAAQAAQDQQAAAMGAANAARPTPAKTMPSAPSTLAA